MAGEFMELRDMIDGELYVFRVLAQIEHNERQYVVIHKVNTQEPADILAVETDSGTQELVWIEDPETFEEIRTIYEKSIQGNETIVIHDESLTLLSGTDQ